MKTRTIGHLLTAALFIHSGIACSAWGQVALNRITISGVPAATGLPNDPAHAGVEMVAGQNRIWFDAMYGGSVRFWSVNGQTPSWSNSIVYPHMGAAMQVVYETGQDSTQGTGGLSANPITVPGDPASLVNNYYAREVQFQPPGPGNPNATYEVRGFGPFFWISHDSIDDAIADEPNSNWRTGYLRGPVRYLTGITLDGSAGGPQDGVFFCGNQWAPTSLPWNQRLVRIKDGRVAFKIKVDLTEAGGAGFAGVLFRKNIAATGTATINDALGADGYQLFLNKAGDVDLWRIAAGAQTLVRHWPHIAPQAATRPVRLEVQTHNALHGWTRVLIDGQALEADASIYNDSNPVLGPHIGLYAFANNGKVHFFDRNVYDVGLEFRAKWTASPAGYVDSDVTIVSALPEVGAHEFVPSGMGMWSNPDYAGPRLDAMEVRNLCGDFLTSTFLNIEACQTQPTATLPNPVTGVPAWMGAAVLKDWGGAARSFWHGSANRQVGVYLTPLSASIDGVPAAGPYGYAVSTGGSSGSTILGMSALDFFQALAGYCSSWPTATSYEVVGRYSLQPDYPGGAPSITRQPADGLFGIGCTVRLDMAATGPTPVSYQWRRGGVPLTDGVTPQGTVISGALTGTLTIRGYSASDAGSYDCIASTSCGSATTRQAHLDFCRAELNCDGLVDFTDYLDFLNAYAEGQPFVDINGDGLVDFADYLEFLNHYDSGC